MKPIVIAVGALGLAACSHSPPTSFYTLDPTPAVGEASSAPATRIQLQAVHIPAVLDRPQVVSEVAADRLRISEQDHWGAPLADLIRRALAQDLAARLAPGLLVLPGAPRPAGARQLVVNILAFEAGTDGRVRLQASWTLLPAAKSQAPLTRDVDLIAKQPSSNAKAQAKSMSALLGRLADQIAATAPVTPN
ncbi:MAG TPA: PqiC family protein [Caulobacteraceae bacterium]|nr:PqiC family protein [Caulobacteraceae bacterium]